MKCPKCDYSNPTGATHCSLCSEVFNKSAADRYLHAQKRALRMQRDAPPPEPEPEPAVVSENVPTRILTEIPRIDWAALFKRCTRIVVPFVQTYRKELGMVSGILLLGVLTIVYTSSAKRLELFGDRLPYVFRSSTPVIYLVGFHTELRSWSERGGRLDTPLDILQKDEIGHIVVTASPLRQKSTGVLLRPRDWIVMQSGLISQNVPLSHPSLAGISKAVLNRQGVVLQRETNYSSRLGRASGFVLPRWPEGTRRPGNHWEEPVEWVQAIGDWKILWKGRLHWKMGPWGMRDGTPCIHLTYQAELRPSLWDTPDWARGAVRNVSFNGTSAGDAYFDTRRHQLFSNDFGQDGALRIAINDIYRIPPDLRVGRGPRPRLGHRAAPVPGTIVIQIKEKVGVHKP